MKITIVCANVSNNSFGRAAILAELLMSEYAVEIVGTAFERSIWPPADPCPVPYRFVRGGQWPRYAASFRQLLGLIDGDVIIASKPLPTSFGAALISRRRDRRPLLLDIDDDEVALTPGPRVSRPTAVAFDLLQPNGGLATRRLQRWASRADAITVASRGLQAEFGGTLITHAKETQRLRPNPEFQDKAKASLGVSGRAVVMFLGSPRPWKGVHTAAAAVNTMQHEAVLVVVGAVPEESYTLELARTPRVVVFPQQPAAELPFILQAADVVVVPQEAQPQSARQLPSKLLDAMAAGKPIVATAVGDLPRILADGRGMVVPPGDPGALAHALDCVLAAPQDAAAMGLRARRWCEDNASYQVVRGHLLEVVRAAVRRTEMK